MAPERTRAGPDEAHRKAKREVMAWVLTSVRGP